MTVEEIEVIGPWRGGLTGERVPLVAATYACTSWRDSASQASANIPPGPNLCTVWARVDVATRAAIEADPLFEVVQPAAAPLAGEERAALNAYLTAAGVQAADLEAATHGVEATASAVISCLRGWCRALKAAAIQQGESRVQPVKAKSAARRSRRKA